MEDTDYALGRTDAEYDRLIEQAELCRPLTERMLKVAGIGPGMHVLDIGCGVGDVSFLVSDLVGPEGSVVGVDLDRDALRRADDRRAARGITNIVFREEDARSVHPERLFDAAVGRFILMFMSDPTAAVRRVAERVRPGGVLAFQDWVGKSSSASAMNLPVLASLQNLLSATPLRDVQTDSDEPRYTSNGVALGAAQGLQPPERPVSPYDADRHVPLIIPWLLLHLVEPGKHAR